MHQEPEVRPGYALFKRVPSSSPLDIAREAGEERPAEPRIRCPQCGWQPRRSDRWICAPCPSPEGLAEGCGTSWHTFDTGGVCPGCAHQWKWTSCFACERWSPHQEWYADDE